MHHLALFAGVAFSLVASSDVKQHLTIPSHNESDICNVDITDRLIFGVQMDTFQRIRKTRRLSCFDWTSDDCTSSPDKPDGLEFQPACQRHDFGYRNTRNQNRFEIMKSAVDLQFKKDLKDICAKKSWLRMKECKAFADLYYFAVKEFGDQKET